MPATIVYWPGVAWTDVTGTDVQLATALGRQTEVLWVDPPKSAFRALREGGLRAVLRRPSVSRPAPGVTMVSSVGPPMPTRRGIRRVTDRLVRRALRPYRARIAAGPTAFVVSTPRPHFAVLPDTVKVYFATDDFTGGAELLGISPAELRRDEDEQLAAADLVLAVSGHLADQFRPEHTVQVLANGCDATMFERIEQATPAADVELEHPIVGVVGQLSSRIDIRILEAVAEAGPSLLLVGPIAPDFEPDRMQRLLARPNVQWTGRRPYDELPSYFRHMDVGLTPYADTAFNRASMPLKTLEYVASGLPVVSTELPAVLELDCPLVLTAAQPSQFAERIDEALRLRSAPGFGERRAEFVALNSWDARASALLSAVEHTVGAPRT